MSRWRIVFYDRGRSPRSSRWWAISLDEPTIEAAVAAAHVLYPGSPIYLVLSIS